ncbi:MEDS domain-containing protein [Streptomyces sp. NPDC017943]|uniref:MEDS domain-containing protein n=1 Tax=Streptomyces sp. NPDC017943 TaxID=3365019 RepID=UPI0037A4919E
MRDTRPTSSGGETAAARHVAVSYSSDDEWAGHLVTFVRAGLDRGEQVQYFADATDPDRVTHVLTEHGVDAAGALRRGQLLVTTAGETYLAGSGFDPESMIGLWQQAVDGAAAEGYRNLRVIGEMSWGTRRIPGADRLLEYEMRIHHEVFERLPLTAWCFYDRRLFPGDALAALAAAHLNCADGAAGGVGVPALSATPLADRPGFRLSGAGGYESRRVAAAAAASLAASPATDLVLDLSDLDHLDVAAVAEIARAARGRPATSPVRILNAPPAFHRVLELFPELGAGLEEVGA